MKRGMVFCLLALCCLLTACGGETPNVYERDGYTVDLEHRTITRGEDVYTFSITGSGDSAEIEITYPNGAAYYWQWNGNFGHGGWSEDYDPDRYADGDTLMDLINFRPEPERSGPSPLLAMLLGALGVFHLAAPRAAWMVSHGWRFKDAEPSDLALAVNRVGGGAAVLAAVLMLLA